MLQRTIRAAGIAVMCLAGAAVTEGAAAAAASAAQVPCRVGGPHGLIAAVKAANRAGRGTLNLAGRCTYILRAPDNEIDGGNGLPVLTGRITINGRAGTTIARSRASSTPDFR